MMLKARCTIIRWLAVTAVFTILLIGSHLTITPVYAGECVASAIGNCTT